MRNKYLENLNKIEFVVTDGCSGKCKHCSQGEHLSYSAAIDPWIGAEVVKRVSKEYEIKTVMTFGGEPLLHPEAVYEIISAAKEMKVPNRQLITNGYFSKSQERIGEIVTKIARCGVNDLLLSVDAFHQETIPLDVVKIFAKEVKKSGISIRLQPAWLVDCENDNPYNVKTREVLGAFGELQIPVSEGNVIFPEGNAAKYLAEYFTDKITENPYVEDPKDLRCLSISANGDVLGKNLYQQDIMEIINGYCG